ncbi:MAG TPA: PQQ-binding-like beta-propeller repeat protein, partial [Rhodothermales bacterium]|nr:PQQ-binding-like beta-propeller repeat protein [Rhodothermales bacterium]
MNTLRAPSHPERRHRGQTWTPALTIFLVCAALIGGCRFSEAEPPQSNTPARPGEWASYGGDPGGARYAGLDQINRDNVRSLQVAWTYHTGEAGVPTSTDRGRSFEATPLVVDGTMYIGTPLGKVIALDPVTGTERWRYDAGLDPNLHFGDFANRGVSTWLDPSAPDSGACRRTIFIATVDARLIAVDAANGRPCTDFGSEGVVDLRKGLRNAPDWPEEYEQTSPPAVVNGLVVVGSAVADNSRPDAASGEVRAFDARTGELRWTWDPVPQDPADPVYNTWQGEDAHRTGGANAWSVLVTDPERNLVFVPTGSPSPDYYGALRLGDNRYANSVTALDAATGHVVWSFQTTHHDLWDYDVAAPPALATVVRDGKPVPAVLAAPKTGMLFVLDRATGQPLFPVEERPVPKSDIPGEEASPTQPFTAVTPPLSPHRFTADDAWGVTP